MGHTGVLQTLGVAPRHSDNTIAPPMGWASQMDGAVLPHPRAMHIYSIVLSSWPLNNGAHSRRIAGAARCPRGEQAAAACCDAQSAQGHMLCANTMYIHILQAM